MSQTEFERENLGRAYPLVDANTPEWLFPVLADATITVRPAAAYTHGKHRISLFAVGQLTTSQASLLAAPGDRYFLAFTCASAPLRGEVLLFTFSDALPRYGEVDGRVLSFAQFMSVVFSSTVNAPAIDGINKWEGYIVVGDYTGIPVLPTMLVNSPYLEPARVTNTVDVASRIGKTYVYNQVMTQYRQPNGCDTGIEPPVFETGTYVLVGSPIVGEFKIAGGHSTRISQNTRNRVITVISDRDGGEAGRVCSPVPVAPNLDDTDTSPRCDEVLRSINGAGGPLLSLSALESVEIGRFPSQHRVIIAPIGIDAANCPAVTEAVPVEYMPVNADDVPCGNDGQPIPPPPGLPDKGAGYVTLATTSTTTAISSGNMCQWQADGSQWQLTSYPCLSPNGCEPPVSLANVVGHIAFTACEYINDGDGAYILNPMFTSASPFNAWDRVGSVTLLTADAGIPNLSLPVARLSPTGSGASLIQRMIAVPSNSTFVLYFECRVLQGVAEIAIGTENNFSAATRLNLTTTAHGTWGEVSIGPLTYASGPLRLVITAGPAAILDIGQFALVKQ